MHGSSEYTFSKPVQFNIFKHHADFIKYYVEQKSAGSDSYEIIADELKRIGHSLIDLYYGSLNPLEISDEIIALLKTKQSLSFREYKNYLSAEGSDYRTVNLSDASKWVLRLSDDSERFIHIHPGKYSPHSIRVRALTLKSAILYTIYTNRERDYMTILDRLNHIRTEYLKLSPQKNLSREHGVGKLMELLKTSY